MELLAQAGKGRRRRRPLIVTILFWVVPLALIGFLVWWFWPRPDPAALELAAFDEVRLPNVPVKLRVHVQGVQSDGRRTDIEGQDVFLVEPKTGLQTKLTTGGRGLAELEQAFAGDEPLIHFLVRIPKEGNRPRLEARGRVFIWPADSSILFVDADHTLADIDPDKFWATNVLAIKQRPGAAPVLRPLAAKYRIVYMSVDANEPRRYNQLRAWLEHSWAPQERFPDGPVFSMMYHYRPTEAQPSFAEQYFGLGTTFTKSAFRGKAAAIAGRPLHAKAFEAAGVQTYLLGPAAEAPESVSVIKSWQHLSEQLP